MYVCNDPLLDHGHLSSYPVTITFSIIAAIGLTLLCIMVVKIELLKLKKQRLKSKVR